MFTPKFVVSESIGSSRIGQKIALDGDETKHAAVLRVRAGDTVRLYSLESATWYEGTYLNGGRADGEITITRELIEIRELKPRVRLYVGTPSSAAMESIVQHTTEAGVAEIIMYRAERTQLKLDAVAREKIHKRLSKIAIAALKQCGAAILPNIELRSDPLTQMLTGGDHRLTFLGSLRPEQGLLAVLAANKSVLSLVEGSPKTADLINVIIGPEGGLTDSEEDELLRLGVTPFSLGPAALRVETACIVTTGIVNAFIQAGQSADAVSKLQTSHLRPQG